MTRLSTVLVLVLLLGASLPEPAAAQPQQLAVDCQSPEFFAICFDDAPAAAPEQQPVVESPGVEPALPGDGPILACVEPGADSDGDGLTDACEAVLGADPANWDTDGDGFSDKVEADLGRDPLVVTNDDVTVDYGGVANASVTPSP